MIYLPHRYNLLILHPTFHFIRFFNHEATPVPPLLAPASAPKSNSLSFSVALLIAFSNSSTVNGVSCAVACFESSSFGISMPLSCWASFVLGSAGAEGTAVGWSERDARREILASIWESVTQEREMGRGHTARSIHAQCRACSHALLPTRARRTIACLRVLVLHTLRP